MTKVLVCPLSGSERTHWINPYLVLNLLRMAGARDFEVDVSPMTDVWPVEYARNHAIALARDKHRADWLLLLDNDQFSKADPLNALRDPHVSGKYVIGLPSFQMAPLEQQAKGVRFIPNARGSLAVDGPFAEVARVATGGMFIHRTIWESLKGPWFRYVLNDDEQGTVKTPEDYFFCDRVREHHFKVWIHQQALGHLKTCDIVSLQRLMQQSTAADPMIVVRD